MPRRKGNDGGLFDNMWRKPGVNSDMTPEASEALRSALEEAAEGARRGDGPGAVDALAEAIEVTDNPANWRWRR